MGLFLCCPTISKSRILINNTSKKDFTNFCIAQNLNKEVKKKDKTWFWHLCKPRELFWWHRMNALKGILSHFPAFSSTFERELGPQPWSNHNKRASDKSNLTDFKGKVSRCRESWRADLQDRLHRIWGEHIKEVWEGRAAWPGEIWLCWLTEACKRAEVAVGGIRTRGNGR